MTTAWEKFKASMKAEAKPWHIMGGELLKTDEETANQRYAICLECPELIGLTKQCKQCGCFMAMKTKIKSAECPLGKWK